MDTWGNKPSVSNPFRPQKDFVEYNKPGKIMVIQASANKAREYAAAWSGLMVARAKELGAQGVIVDGHVREVVEMRRLNFPVRSPKRKRNCRKLKNGMSRTKAVSPPPPSSPRPAGAIHVDYAYAASGFVTRG